MEAKIKIRDVVDDPVKDSNAQTDIASIAVTPATPSFSTTQQMVATATMRDGSTRVVTGAALWTSSDPTKATINSAGLATKVAAGATTLSASLGGKTGSTAATVT